MNTKIGKEKGYFNSGGWKFLARGKIVGMGKEGNPGRDEFPHGLNLKRKLKRLFLIGPGDPRQDLPAP
jgi:hypothetical protein